MDLKDRKKKQENGENYTVRSFIVCTLHEGI
jgi:hypothetical protein